MQTSYLQNNAKSSISIITIDNLRMKYFPFACQEKKNHKKDKKNSTIKGTQ